MRRRARAYLSDEAIGYFERALARLDRTTADPGILSTSRDEARLAAFVWIGSDPFRGRAVDRGGSMAATGHCAGETDECTAARLARLYYWLGDVLFWQDRLDEMAALGEEGLRLFGEGESVEAALMHGLISWGMFLSDSAERWQHVTILADVLPRLPYCEELRARVRSSCRLLSVAREGSGSR